MIWKFTQDDFLVLSTRTSFWMGMRKRAWKLAFGWHGIEQEQLSEQSAEKQTSVSARTFPRMDVAFSNPLSWWRDNAMPARKLEL